jgi:hypothetical protein
VNCKLCHSRDTAPLPFAIPPELPPWVRCVACGSDSAAATYDDVRDAYGLAYLTHQLESAGGFDGQANQLRGNLDWFDRHHVLGPERTFLDVGCCEGGALDGMRARGWDVGGFDVFPVPYAGPHVTIAPLFHRWLFPQRFAAVLCREVWEHVPAPELFLHELHGVTLPNGLVQIQTPRPWHSYHANPYQRVHLHLASPVRLREMLAGAMLDVVDHIEWEMGQAYLCRARP